MKKSTNDKPISVVMYIASFYPQSMGGMEMQGFRLAQQLMIKGISVSIFTHGFKGCRKEEIYEGIRIVRLYSFLNRIFDTLLNIKNKLTFKKSGSIPLLFKKTNGLPYDASDTGIKINGNLSDLIYYIIQIFNFALRLRINRKQTDLIHVHGVPWVSFVGVTIGRFYKIPIIVKESTTIGLKKYDDFIWGNRLRKYVLTHAHFVAISKHIYQLILNYGLSSKRIYYIPNGTFIPPKAAVETADKLTALFVGNLTQGAAKGLDILLQAWAIVIARYPDAKLLVVGNTGNLEPWLQVLASLAIEKDVTFLGSKNNMNEIFEQTTIYVSPSRREGLSNALLEAMAFGLPCIATNISGSQDMIEHGLNGYLVEPNNPVELADAILLTFSSKVLRESMRQQSYAKVKEHCSFDKVTQEYQKIYSSILNRPTNEDILLKAQTQAKSLH